MKESYELEMVKELEKLLTEVLEVNKILEPRAEFTMYIEGGRYPACTVSLWINGDKPSLVTRYTVYLLEKHKMFNQSSIEEIRERIRSEKEKYLNYVKGN